MTVLNQLCTNWRCLLPSADSSPIRKQGNRGVIEVKRLPLQGMRMRSSKSKSSFSRTAGWVRGYLRSEIDQTFETREDYIGSEKA